MVLTEKKKKKDLVFRAVLGSHKNRRDVAEISHLLPARTHAEPPKEWSIC